jgi:hypothetical protein
VELTLHWSGKVLVVAGVLSALGYILACPPTAAIEATCTDLCSSQLACGQALGTCEDACGSTQTACTLSGHPSTFQAYINCAADAGFSCDDAGQPVVNAPCNPLDNDLIQCQFGASFDAADDALAAKVIAEVADAAAVDSLCVSTTTTSGSCIHCCADHHEGGAEVFAAAVHACECGDGGACAPECGTQWCANPNEAPDANGSCDQCLTNTLDDQAAEAGACVVPVTKTCNRVLDCALYVNCATQAGCTN